MRIMSPRDVAAAFLAWMDCVARTIGGGVESLRRLPRVRLIEEADAFRLKIPARGNSGPVDFDSFQIDNGRIIGRDCEQITAALRGSRTELILSGDQFLFRPLELPKEAGEFLDGIIRSQIDRLTPWSADEAAFAWSQPIEIENDRIAFNVVATSRSLILPYIDTLKKVGATSIVVSAFPSPAQSGVAPIEIFQQRGAARIDPGKLRPWLIAVLVATALFFGCAVLAGQIAGAGLEAQKGDVLRRIANYQPGMPRDGLGDAGQLELERRKGERPPRVVVLETISKILPDHTYLTELRIEGDRLQVVGITQDAPSLIRLLEQSHFARATFSAPTTRSPGDRGEHFQIEAQIKPGFAMQ